MLNKKQVYLCVCIFKYTTFSPHAVPMRAPNFYTNAWPDICGFRQNAALRATTTKQIKHTWLRKHTHSVSLGNNNSGGCWCIEIRTYYYNEDAHTHHRGRFVTLRSTSAVRAVRTYCCVCARPGAGCVWVHCATGAILVIIVHIQLITLHHNTSGHRAVYNKSRLECTGVGKHKQLRWASPRQCQRGIINTVRTFTRNMIPNQTRTARQRPIKIVLPHVCDSIKTSWHTAYMPFAWIVCVASTRGTHEHLFRCAYSPAPAVDAVDTDRRQPICWYLSCWSRSVVGVNTCWGIRCAGEPNTRSENRRRV